MKNIKRIAEEIRQVVCPIQIEASTQRYCHIYKSKSGKWWLELAPNEYGEQHQAFTYGPFASENEADDYINEFSNPGAVSYDRSGKQKDPTRSPNGQSIRK